MGRIYIKSLKCDRTCLDTQATNMVRDILIMCGIYDDFVLKHDEFEKEQFITHYKNILKKTSFYSWCNFAGEYHFFNCGIRILRELSINADVYTSGIRIRHLCATYRTFPVKVVMNIKDILNVLFEYVYNNDVLKTTFTDVILKKCEQYTVQITKYPDTCSASILGFIDVFLKNGEGLPYSEKHKEISDSVKEFMDKTINKYNLKFTCGKRKSDK